MVLADIKKQAEDIGTRIQHLTSQIEALDRAIMTSDDPEVSYVYSIALQERAVEYEHLLVAFKDVLEQYDKASKEEANVISFTAKKLLKAIDE